jgi:hypothetical protein
MWVLDRYAHTQRGSDAKRLGQPDGRLSSLQLAYEAHAHPRRKGKVFQAQPTRLLA